MKLKGKVALVTGGGRGIGRGIVLALANEGADIAIADIIYPNAEKVAGEVKKLGRRAIALKADVTNWDQVQAMVKQTIGELGQLDILVNDAGVVHVAPLEEVEEKAWDHVMAVNVKGIFLCCKAVIPHMKQRGSGKIINVASIAGKQGGPRIVLYATSKAAVVGFTYTLGSELAKDNINVNAICPGFVQSDVLDALGAGLTPAGESPKETIQQMMNAMVPRGKIQTPEEMGALAVFFATNDGITGQSWNVDGGATSH